MLVHGNRGARRRGHLHAVFLTPEVVGDLPVGRTALAWSIGAMLYVPGCRLLTTIATNVGAHRCPRDNATGSGEILTASVTDLVTENAPE